MGGVSCDSVHPGPYTLIHRTSMNVREHMDQGTHQVSCSKIHEYLTALVLNQNVRIRFVLSLPVAQRHRPQLVSQIEILSIIRDKRK
jgi:hypothetical protein